MIPLRQGGKAVVMEMFHTWDRTEQVLCVLNFSSRIDYVLPMSDVLSTFGKSFENKTGICTLVQQLGNRSV